MTTPIVGRYTGPVGARFRTGIAFVMAAVAIVSASIAYSAAEWATQAAQKNGQALQQRAEQARILQRINIELAEDTRLYSVYAGHWDAAVAARNQATAIRATDPTGAGALDLEYEAQQATMDALWPLFQAATPTGDGDTLTFSTAEAARLLKAQDPDLPDLDPEARRAEAQGLHQRAVDLVLVIVFLIGALLVLTVAQVIGRGARLVAGIGIVLALAATARIGFVDPQTVPLLLIGGALAVVLAGLWLLAPRLHRRLPLWIVSQEQGTDAAETSVHGASRSHVIHEGGVMEPSLVGADEPSDRAGRLIAVAMAVVTLVAGAIGYRQLVTFRQAADQAELAQQDALSALDEQVTGDEQAQSGIFTHGRAIETRMAASSARQQRLYWLSFGDDRRAGDLLLIENAREAEATAAARVDLIAANDGALDYSTSPPTGDAYFPNRYLVKAEQEALRLSALQDASNEASADLTSRGRDYTFGIALLAIVLYLLGLALVLRATALRTIFYAASGILVVLCLIRVVPALAAPDPVDGAAERNANEAAMHYSEGLVAIKTATTPGQFVEAADHLRQAIVARPHFARAYAALADATLLAATPQQSGYASLDDPVSRSNAIASLEQAQANGADTPKVRLELGFLLYRQATDPSLSPSVNAELLARSIDVTRDAIAVAPADYLYRSIALDNLGVALVAAGRLAEAEQAYRESIDYILYLDGGRQPRPDWWREQIVAGALTDLDNLSSHHDTFRDDVDRTKADLVSQVWPTANGAGATLVDLAIADFSPAMLQWTASVEGGVNLLDHVVVVQWYRLSDSGEWYAMPDRSGLASGSAWSGNVWYSKDDNAIDSYFGQAAMTSARILECLTDGDQYRVEVYIDGVLAGQAGITVGAGETRPVDGAELRPVDAGDVGLAFCRPPDWTVIPDSRPGLVTGYLGPGSAGPARGILVFRIQRPKTADDTGDTAGAIDEVLSATGYASLIPAMTLSSEDSSFAFHGLVNGIGRYYDTDAGGTARVQAMAQSDGTVMVTIVYGSKADFEDGGLGLRLNDSLLPHN